MEYRYLGKSGLQVWALARESHTALAVVDETLWFVFIRNFVII